MRLMIDTNVFLDVILAREPLVAASSRILELSNRDDVELLMPAHAASTILYIVESNRSRDIAIAALSECLGIAHIAALDEAAILTGMAYDFHDVEDSFVAAVAVRERCDAIVTTNVTDFANSPVPAIATKEFIAGVHGVDSGSG